MLIFAVLVLDIRILTCFPYIVGPDITKGPENQTTNSSNNVTFKCIALANPNPVIGWKKDGKVLNNTTKRLIHVHNNSRNCIIDDKCDLPSRSNCESSTTLQLSDVTPHDNGEYSCHFTNEIGSKWKRAILSVDGMYIVLCI